MRPNHTKSFEGFLEKHSACKRAMRPYGLHSADHAGQRLPRTKQPRGDEAQDYNPNITTARIRRTQQLITKMQVRQGTPGSASQLSARQVQTALASWSCCKPGKGQSAEREYLSNGQRTAPWIHGQPTACGAQEQAAIQDERPLHGRDVARG